MKEEWRIFETKNPKLKDKFLCGFIDKKKTEAVTFDQNVKNAISAEFGILAVSLPDWWFLRTKSVIGTFGQTVRAGIF